MDVAAAAALTAFLATRVRTATTPPRLEGGGTLHAPPSGLEAAVRRASDWGDIERQLWSDFSPR